MQPLWSYHVLVEDSLCRGEYSVRFEIEMAFPATLAFSFSAVKSVSFVSVVVVEGCEEEEETSVAAAAAVAASLKSRCDRAGRRQPLSGRRTQVTARAPRRSASLSRSPSSSAEAAREEGDNGQSGSRASRPAPAPPPPPPPPFVAPRGLGLIVQLLPPLRARSHVSSHFSLPLYILLYFGSAPRAASLAKHSRSRSRAGSQSVSQSLMCSVTSIWGFELAISPPLPPAATGARFASAAGPFPPVADSN